MATQANPIIDEITWADTSAREESPASHETHDQAQTSRFSIWSWVPGFDA